MIDSILESTKKLFGLGEDCNSFDPDLVVFINAAFNILTQLGIGPIEGFRINGSDEVWESFTGNNVLLEMVKSYIFMRVRISFDPPSSATVMQAYKDQIQELEYRIYITANPIETFDASKDL